MKKIGKLAGVLACAALLLCACTNDAKKTDKMDDTKKEAAREEKEKKQPDSKKDKVEDFKEVTLWDDESCTVVQTSAFASEKGKPGASCKIRVENHTDGFLSGTVGKNVYINDVSRMEYYGSSGKGENVYVRPQETVDLEYACRMGEYSLKEDDRVEVSMEITYDNGEVGVYKETTDIVKGLFDIHMSGNKDSSLYEAEPGDVVKEDDICKVVGINNGSDGDSTKVLLYLENKSDAYLTFGFENIEAASDQQKARSIMDFDRCGWPDDLAVEDGWQKGVDPKKGCYLEVNLSKNEVDSFAKDISEQVKVIIPVYAVEREEIRNMEVVAEGNIESRNMTLEFTREWLRGQENK